MDHHTVGLESNWNKTLNDLTLQLVTCVRYGATFAERLQLPACQEMKLILRCTMKGLARLPILWPPLKVDPSESIQFVTLTKSVT